MSNGLRIPKNLLISASGLDKKIVESDIQNRVLLADDNGDVWFHDAFTYVKKKWEDGALMFAPDNGTEHYFAERVLSRLDDQISAGNLEINWKKPYKE